MLRFGAGMILELVYKVYIIGRHVDLFLKELAGIVGHYFLAKGLRIGVTV